MCKKQFYIYIANAVNCLCQKLGCRFDNSIFGVIYLDLSVILFPAFKHLIHITFRRLHSPKSLSVEMEGTHVYLGGKKKIFQEAVINLALMSVIFFVLYTPFLKSHINTIVSIIDVWSIFLTSVNLPQQVTLFCMLVSY